MNVNMLCVEVRILDDYILLLVVVVVVVVLHPWPCHCLRTAALLSPSLSLETCASNWHPSLLHNACQVIDAIYANLLFQE